MHCFYRVFFTLWPRHVIDVSWFSPKHMGCACGLVSRYMGTYILKAIFSNFLFPSAFMSAALVWVCAKRPRKGRVLVIFFPCRGCRGRDRPLFLKMVDAIAVQAAFLWCFQSRLCRCLSFAHLLSFCHSHRRPGAAGGVRRWLPALPSKTIISSCFLANCHPDLLPPRVEGGGRAQGKPHGSSFTRCLSRFQAKRVDC